MLGKILGAVIGRSIDRRDGKGGLKGAVIGAVAAGGLRRAFPLMLLAGGAYALKKAWDRRNDAVPDGDASEDVSPQTSSPRT